MNILKLLNENRVDVCILINTEIISVQNILNEFNISS